MVRLPGCSPILQHVRWVRLAGILFTCLAGVSLHAQKSISKSKTTKVRLITVAKAVEDIDRNGRVDREGETVRIRGSVTTEVFPAFRGDEREYRLYVQDDTAGIRIVSPVCEPLKNLIEGIEGEIIGRIGQYRGTPFLSVERIVDFRPAVSVEPKQVEIEGFDPEAVCGQLVRLSGPVRYEDARYYVGADKATRIRLFLRPSKNYVPFIAKIHDGLTIDVVGVIEQYDRSAPWQGGYRIRPRQLSDVHVLSPFWMMAPVRYTAYVLLVGFIVAGVFLTIRWRRVKRQFESPQAQRMHALGTMAGGIAHEFNNYLLAIMGFAELARSEVDDSSSTREHLDQVLDASSRAKDLIVQILAFGRQKDAELQVISARDAIEEGVSLLRAIMPASVVVRANLGVGADQITADRGQLSQLLLNLGTNAAHALPEGGDFTVSLRSVAIDVEQRREFGLPQNGRHMMLEVSDNGVGMDTATLGHIFEPFFTTRGRTEGTGLGLSVVHGIVKRHRGAVRVESTLGRGTTFRCYFPVVLRANKSRVALRSPQPAMEPERTALISTTHDSDHDALGLATAVQFDPALRVMIVDDQAVVIRLLDRLLRSQGFKVTVMRDAVAAAAMLSDDPYAFDMLITDLAMPRMTGLQLARRVHDVRPGLPVILMTGNASHMTDDDLVIAGIGAVLDKPFTKQGLLQVMAGVLSA